MTINFYLFRRNIMMEKLPAVALILCGGPFTGGGARSGGDSLGGGLIHAGHLL
jgi:hypothetical protein